MAEETGGLSLKEIYWGGSTSMNGKYEFLTFGDHYSSRADLRPVVADGKKIGAMMFALREGPQTDEQLAAAARINRAAAGPIIKQLVEIGWVDHDGPMYVSRIPVLTSRDMDIVSGVLKVCNEVMAAWLDENYAKIREELAGITPLRQKVPYDQTFDQVWHYVFGMTNRKLVRTGLFADPYAVGQKRPGYFSAIFDASASPKF